MAVAGLARRFAAEGHELALVGGAVRDVFLGRRHGDLDLATDARPGEVRTIIPTPTGLAAGRHAGADLPQVGLTPPA